MRESHLKRSAGVGMEELIDAGAIFAARECCVWEVVVLGESVVW